MITAMLATLIGLGGSTPTIALTELHGQYPVCFEEDCSDQPGQVGLWQDQDTGNWYLSIGEEGWLVVDDTVR
ncbi:hypothetical protein KIY75_gp84 [Mycobacterium phage Noelle]|uniref:Uncharacterized protein n=1 Tax=Mycobacterium phage Noelle TaxID=2572317 RepID=A0A6B9LEC4_9CAUD|nr:hypothetical protein KIY75_gp84 [Mycobacterium phage Noelle]QHB38111.1 hypothetical protein SEA_NOELLE_84 [Mycobacterium phage Noelle]